MAFIEVARFSELHEGHIAAGALTASGIEAWFPGYGWGAVDWTMRQATAGFPLYVDEALVEEARALLNEVRKPNPEALDWRRHPKVWSGIPLALLSIIDPAIGMTILGARSPTRWRRIAGAAILATIALLIVLVVVLVLQTSDALV